MNRLKHILYKLLKVVSFIMLFTIYLVFSTGCSTVKPEPVVIVKTKYKVVQIPDSFLSPCEVSRPPEQSTYINSNYIKKEKLLTDYILNLLTDVENCSLKLKSIKELQVKQETIYRQYNTSVEESTK